MTKVMYHTHAHVHTHTHTHTMEYYSAVKKGEIMPFVATWTDIRDYHTK